MQCKSIQKYKEIQKMKEKKLISSTLAVVILTVIFLSLPICFFNADIHFIKNKRLDQFFLSAKIFHTPALNAAPTNGPIIKIQSWFRASPP